VLANFFFGHEAVNFVPQAHLEAPIPKSAEGDIDFASVNRLKFNREIHAYDCGKHGAGLEKEKS
jgi:hypothetical protein